jgi:hypothetical protein
VGPRGRPQAGQSTVYHLRELRRNASTRTYRLFRERQGGKPEMNERGKPDGPVAPANPLNKAEAAEAGEERGPAKGNTDGETHRGRRAGIGVSRDLDRVREVAVRDKQVGFKPETQTPSTPIPTSRPYISSHLVPQVSAHRETWG